MIGRDLEYHGDESIYGEGGLWPIFSGQGLLPAAGVSVLLAAGAFPGRTTTGSHAQTVRDRWHLAAARVVDRNAQILVLRLAARALHRKDVVQTELLVPIRMSLRDIESWVLGTDQELAQDRCRLRRALVREALRLRTDRRPPMDPRLLIAARRVCEQRRDQATPRRINDRGRLSPGARSVPDAHPERDWLIDRLGSVLTGELALPDDVQDIAERLRCQIEESAQLAYLCRLVQGHLASPYWWKPGSPTPWA